MAVPTSPKVSLRKLHSELLDSPSYFRKETLQRTPRESAVEAGL